MLPLDCSPAISITTVIIEHIARVLDEMSRLISGTRGAHCTATE